ncbi:sodium-independent sulfate anion transporter-like isoform X1 [Trichogramma pretiosum]|uniref:sodium-independent sulfate anion transporter-like isoform X1 n=1 Tax=Trichogramma pretiosum TaxID=7493 RepID=UPI000C71AA58|nr:sodium-independent sulfate anion transporter-like isoform X1 [Trichogramma pretiosum]
MTNTNNKNSLEEGNSGGRRVSKIRAKNSNKIHFGRYIPIVKWLPKYSKYQAVGDAIAGLTIGLTMIPQSIAYAALAGQSAQFGLYSSFLGGFLYAVFGTVKEVSIGPTSLMSLLTLEFTRDTNMDFVVLLTFLAGCIEFIMGLLDLGFLVDFISLPVTSGFTSATAIIIIGSQLKGLFGLKFQSKHFVDQITKIFTGLKDMRLGDTCLGISCIIVLLILRKLKDVKVKSSETSRARAFLAKSLWFVSVARNAIVVLLCSVLSYYFHQRGQMPFVLSGQVRSGLPSFSLPNFTTSINNQTYGFFDMCSHMGSGIVVLPMVSVLANVAIAKVFATGSISASQEMRTLGLCNLMGSCVSSLPTCGAFTRSAVSSASGIQTPLAGVYSGLMAILALSYLTPYFYFIPKATLSAVLICAVVFLFDWRIFQPLWKGSKKDAVATLGTFVVCCVFTVEAGLMLGIVSNIVYLLYLSARPAIKVTECTVRDIHNIYPLISANLEHKYLLVQPDVGLFFPAVDFLSQKMVEIAEERAPGNMPLVLDCQRFRGVDYTAVKGLEKLAKDFEKSRRTLWFLNLNVKIVKSIRKLGDLDNLKILKSEADIITIFCGIEGVNVEKDIPMKCINVDSLFEAESLLAKEKCAGNDC